MQNDVAKRVDRTSKFIEIDNVKIHYTEMGAGRPILFLHSIPMSSFVFQGMLSHLSTMGRCIAPDLIGCGHSDKPADLGYTIFEHIHYIEKFIEKLNLQKIVLVMHGLGSVIGFDIAMRQQANFSGLVFYEAFIRPMTPDDISLPYKEQLLALQHESAASLHDTKLPTLIEHILAQLTIDDIPVAIKKRLMEPFNNENALKPLLEYLRELPTGDGLNQIDHVIAKYFKPLASSSLPKLMFYSLPGFITTIATVMWAKDHIKRLEIMEVGEELHVGNITYGNRMAEMISIWLQGIEQSGG